MKSTFVSETGWGETAAELNKDQNHNASQGLPSLFHRVLIQCTTPAQQAFFLVCARGYPKGCRKSTDAQARYYPSYTSSFTGTDGLILTGFKEFPKKPAAVGRQPQQCGGLGHGLWHPDVPSAGKLSKRCSPPSRSPARWLRDHRPSPARAGRWQGVLGGCCDGPGVRRHNPLGRQPRSQLRAPITAHFRSGTEQKPRDSNTRRRSLLILLGEAETQNST